MSVYIIPRRFWFRTWPVQVRRYDRVGYCDLFGVIGVEWDR